MTAVKENNGVVEIQDYLTVRELAEKLEVSPINIIKELMNNGIMASINQNIDFDTAAIVGEEMGFEVVPFQEHVIEETTGTETTRLLRQTHLSTENPNDLLPRPPVVTVLGHVDHGKTTLLDSIRSANVVDGESGGITQHIGAYQVTLGERKITFLDTPGHAAFTAMRARGAMVTDIAILMVAADDGVMPQTKEAINHVKAAGVPIIVAVNKIDKENASPERVKQDLANEGLVPEEWGGDTICVPVSALNNIGIDDLLENVLLTAEVNELQANPNRSAEGTIIESRLDEKRGVYTTLLIQNGTLHQGDIVVADQNYGRIKAMFDSYGQKIKHAGPSVPISILGLSNVPEAGSFFEVVKNKKAAEALIAKRQKEMSRPSSLQNPVSLEDFISRLEGERTKYLNLIIKADVQGSLEPIINSLEGLGDDDHKIKILHHGTGNVTESDVSLALASQAIIVGFHVNIDEAARKIADSEGIEIRIYKVIYQLIENVELALKGLYEPVYEDRVIGHAMVKAVFRVGKGAVAGCVVSDGKIVKGSYVRLVRNKKLHHQSTLNSLRRFTDDVQEVSTGLECGIGIDGFTDYQENDILEVYIKERVN